MGPIPSVRTRFDKARRFFLGPGPVASPSVSPASFARWWRGVRRTSTHSRSMDHALCPMKGSSTGSSPLSPHRQGISVLRGDPPVPRAPGLALLTPPTEYGSLSRPTSGVDEDGGYDCRPVSNGDESGCSGDVAMRRGSRSSALPSALLELAEPGDSLRACNAFFLA